MDVDTLISSIWTFNNSISFLLIKYSVWPCSSLCSCEVSIFSSLLTFSSNTAMALSIADVSTTACSCDSIASNLVTISPYLTNPPPIATIAGIKAAIPASWSLSLPIF